MQALVGWFEVPQKVVQDTPIEVVINPRGSEIRNKKRVWNAGDGRMRLYTIGTGAALERPKEQQTKRAGSIEESFEKAYSRMPLF